MNNDIKIGMLPYALRVRHIIEKAFELKKKNDEGIKKFFISSPMWIDYYGPFPAINYSTRKYMGCKGIEYAIAIEPHVNLGFTIYTDASYPENIQKKQNCFIKEFERFEKEVLDYVLVRNNEKPLRRFVIEYRGVTEVMADNIETALESAKILGYAAEDILRIVEQ